MLQSVGLCAWGVSERCFMFFLLNNGRSRPDATLANAAGLCGFSIRPGAKRCLAAVMTQDKRAPADYGHGTPVKALFQAGRGGL